MHYFFGETKKRPQSQWFKRLNRNRERNVSTDLGRLGGTILVCFIWGTPKEEVMLSQIASLVVYSVTSFASTNSREDAGLNRTDERHIESLETNWSRLRKLGHLIR
jgi:hypothetical protein